MPQYMPPLVARAESDAGRPASAPVAAWSLAAAAVASGLVVAVYAGVEHHLVHGLLLLGTVGVFAAVLAVVDLRTFLLPNRLVAPLAIFGLVQAVGVSLVTQDFGRLLISVGAAAIVGAVYVGLGLAGWFGLGDAKFAAALALSVAVYAGWLTLYITAIAIILGALQRVALMAMRRDQAAGRAHGPAIAIAGVSMLAIAILAST